MALAPVAPSLSVEEYFESSHHPDWEYVDGIVRERSMPTTVHSFLQALLAEYFRHMRKQFRYGVLVEARTELIPRSRYRIPDVSLCGLPVPSGKFVDTVPWVVIEVLSPDDKLRDELERFREYAQRGVKEILLLDPEKYVAYRFDDGSLVQSEITDLLLPTGERLPFVSAEIFRQLRDELAEQ